MKVSELIELLKEMDPDVMVLVDGYEGGLCTPQKPEFTPIRKFAMPDKYYYGAHDGCYPEDKSADGQAVYIGRGGGYAHEGAE